MPEIGVDGMLVWYSEHGHGPHAVLVLPGAIGTAESDFDVQLNPASSHCFDFTKFKFVCIELHGWGRLNQQRIYDPNILERDADYCHHIMQFLGHEQYSVYGWSEGAKVALVLAHRLGPEVIRCAVAHSVIPYQSALSTRNLMWSRNVRNWDPAMLAKFAKAYGGDVDKVANLWNQHMDYVKGFENYFPDGLLGPLNEGLQQVKCPTLVLHGERDFFVDLGQSKYASDNIPGAKLVIFDKAGHNLHQQYPSKFKKVVEDFFSAH